MITAALVGTQSPRRVQLLVDTAPAGVPWTITGTAGALTWTVPGGQGVGDGGQVTRIDNRAPLNVPIDYRFTAGDVDQSAPTIVVPQAEGDAVFQSLDGQRTVVVNLQEGSQQFDQDASVNVSRIPGRRRPVIRYSATSDVAGSLIARAPLSSTPAMDALIAPGAPLLCRMTGPTLDMSLVSVITLLSIRSSGDLVGDFREWVFGYVTVDDPYMDEILGLVTWEQWGSILSGYSWGDFGELMAGLTWGQFDTFDWTQL